MEAFGVNYKTKKQKDVKKLTLRFQMLNKPKRV